MDEAQQSFAAIRHEATRAATAQEITTILVARFALYPQPERTDAEWASWWADYHNALDDLPPSAIEAGMAAYVKGPDSEFFPKPGRIRDLAKTTPNPLASACEGVRRNIERRQRQTQIEHAPPQPASPEPNEGDKAKVRAMLAGFQKSMAERAPPKRPVLPPTPVKVDEAGLSSLMRERMEREGG